MDVGLFCLVQRKWVVSRCNDIARFVSVRVCDGPEPDETLRYRSASRECEFALSPWGYIAGSPFRVIPSHNAGSSILNVTPNRRFIKASLGALSGPASLSVMMIWHGIRIDLAQYFLRSCCGSDEGGWSIFHWSLQAPSTRWP